MRSGLNNQRNSTMGDRSKYFSTWELRCGGLMKGSCDCGGSSPINPVLLEVLDRYRHMTKCLIYLNSAFRCLTHNTSEGSDDTSQHPLGNAADIKKIERYTIQDMVNVAMLIEKIRGIGYYDWGIHIDVGDREALTIWDERTGT